MRIIPCLILLVYSFLEAAEAISGESLLEWINGNAPFEFIIIDVRDTSSARSTGVIGKGSCSAYNIPFTLFNKNTIDSMLEIIPKDTATVFYCFSDNVSSTMADDFSNYDEKLARLYYLEKGFRAWDGPIVPVEKVKPNDIFPSTFCSETSISYSITPKIKTEKGHDNSVFDLHGRICGNSTIKIPGIHIVDKKTIMYLKHR